MDLYKVFREIIIGIIVGIVTFSIIEIVKASIIQIGYQIRNWFYDGVKINDTWEGKKDDNGYSYGFKFKLRQYGYKISGSYTTIDIKLAQSEPINPEVRNFKVKGVIKNNYISLSYYPKSKKNIGKGSFIFQILDDGNKMAGSMCYFKTSTGGTGCATDIELIRKI